MKGLTLTLTLPSALTLTLTLILTLTLTLTFMEGSGATGGRPRSRRHLYSQKPGRCGEIWGDMGRYREI